jgi:DNA-binding transcriptional MerR regulator
MAKVKGFEIVNQYMLEAKKGLLSLKEIAKEAKQNNIPLTVRMIHSFVSKGLVEKPMKIGRQVYYREDYIIPALTCIFLLKVQFGIGLSKLKKIMAANSSSTETLFDKMQFFLQAYGNKDKRPNYYYLLEKDFLEKIAAGDLEIDFDRLEKQARDTHGKYLKG